MRRSALALAACAVFLAGASCALAQFTYQGRLFNAGTPIAGAVDIQASLWNSAGAGNPPTGGTQIGSVQNLTGVALDNGVFSVVLNPASEFGASAFDGSPRWVQIAVREPAGSANPFVVTGQRQRVYPTPYATFATKADTVRAISTDGSGRVGIGTGAAGGQTLAVKGVDGNALTSNGDEIALAAGNGFLAGSGNGGFGSALKLGGGTNGLGTGGFVGGSASLSGGRGSDGIGTTGAGGNVYLRPGLPGNASTSGTVIAKPGYVNIDTGGASSLIIGAENTASSGRSSIIIRTTAATGECHIQAIQQAGSAYGALVLNPEGGVVAKIGGGAFAVYSDARLKHDLTPLTGTLDKLLSLRGYSFEYTDDALARKHALPGTQIGLLAQDVQKVFPQWIDTDADGYMMVTERATTALMVESLRDLRSEKDAQVQSLRDENARLRQRLERLERLIEGTSTDKPADDPAR